MTRAKAKPRSYHHGALREALLAAALEILEEDGLEGLTLRGVAARANVSHAAPAHHFPSMRALRTALGEIAFHRFGAAMTEARATADKTPVAQLRAAGVGYLTFARANPGLFKLMFTDSLIDCDDPAYVDSAGAAFAQLVEISMPAAEALGYTSEAERVEIIKLVWSVAHGYAHLVLERQMRALEPQAHASGDYTPPDLAAIMFAVAKT